MLPRLDLTTSRGRTDLAERLAALRQQASATSEYAKVAQSIIEATRRDGDDEVVRQMRQWVDPHFTADRIVVETADLGAALKRLDGKLRGAIEASIEHVRAYQQHILPKELQPLELDGAELGIRFTPVERVGLTIPGGSAVLFSSLIMLAVPALVAGVEAKCISVVNPPAVRDGDPNIEISGVVLATCKLLGLEKVYRMNGPAAVAALAFGTERVEPVDMVVGPGHPTVAAAQAQLRNVVGTGDFYGASEIVVVADDAADPDLVAADLVAQAEHDPGKCFLVAWSAKVIDRIIARVQQQLPARARRQAIEKALQDESLALLVKDEAQAVEVVNALACEHVSLTVGDPQRLLGKIRHGGQVFLGSSSPVAAGDYYAGPSHTLPTNTTARFASGVSVYTFLKRTGTIHYRDGLAEPAIDAIVRMAEIEGLDGHAHSVRLRRAKPGK